MTDQQALIRRTVEWLRQGSLSRYDPLFVELEIAALEAPAAAEGLEYRCFHCGDTFTGEAALEHFGTKETAEAVACVLSTKHPLVVRLRKRIADLEYWNKPENQPTPAAAEGPPAEPHPLNAAIRPALNMPSGLRLTTCTRGRTVGNVYNYSYWACGECLYHPGDSEGPPSDVCLNCGAHLYTDKLEDANTLILLKPERNGLLHFAILHEFRPKRVKGPAQGEAMDKRAPTYCHHCDNWADGVHPDHALTPPPVRAEGTPPASEPSAAHVVRIDPPLNAQNATAEVRPVTVMDEDFLARFSTDESFRTKFIDTAFDAGRAALLAALIAEVSAMRKYHNPSTVDAVLAILRRQDQT